MGPFSSYEREESSGSVPRKPQNKNRPCSDPKELLRHPLMHVRKLTSNATILPKKASSSARLLTARCLWFNNEPGFWTGDSAVPAERTLDARVRDKIFILVIFSLPDGQ